MQFCSCASVNVTPPTRGTLALTVQQVAHLPDKARIYPGSGQMQVDKRAWAAWTRIERAAAVAHELAHEEEPAGCEGCADERAGAILRHFGVTRDSALAAFRRIVGGRRTGATVGRGWDAADRALGAGEGSYAPRKFRTSSTAGEGMSEGTPDVDGTSWGIPGVDYAEDGQSIGAPAPSPTAPARPRAPSGTTKPAPAPAAATSIAIPLALAAAAALAVFFFLSR